MPKKGENIFKRKDGRWEARYVKGYELSGKIRYGYCYGKSYREAKAKVDQIKAAILNDQPIQSAKKQLRFAFYCGEWLAIQKSRVRESTYIKYDSMLRRHIIPALGDCCPPGISTAVVESFKAGLLEKGLSPQSVKNILMVVHTVLWYAAENHPGVFPRVEIRYPKEPKNEPRVLSVREQQLFEEYLCTDMDPCKFGVLLALLTGLRIGEICALRWENISLRDGTLRVDSAMQRLKNMDSRGESKTKIVIGAPKSDTSIRTIPLPLGVVKLCQQHDPRMPEAFVLTGNIKYMEPRALQRRLNKYTKECGLEDVHFHTLRHTFATRCMEVGFELKSLSEILGHAKVSTTLDRYVHSSLDTKRSNMEKLALSRMR